MKAEIFRNKTWKEELSIAIVIYLMYLGYISAVGPLEILVWPFMAFVTAAFGMTEFAKVAADKSYTQVNITKETSK